MEEIDNIESDELVDPKAVMKERRGKTLPVLCVLTVVNIGWMLFNAIMGMARGKASIDDLQEVEVNAMEGIQGDTPDIVVRFVLDSIEFAYLANDKVYLMNGLDLLMGGLGLLSVWMMYKLKKVGFYIYLVYCIAAIIIPLVLFPGNMLGQGLAFMIGLMSILFIILYAVQLKRMD